MALDEDDFEAMDLDEQDDFIPILYAEDLAEAERYCQVLVDHDIPAIVDEDYEDIDSLDDAGIRQGIAVLAPSALGEEAGSLIEQFEEINATIDENGEFVQDSADYNEGEADELAGDGRDTVDYDDDDDLGALGQDEPDM